MAAPRPGNTDRGWNDPPMFDYLGSNMSTVTGSHQHHKLNKRVAYPMSPPSTSATTTGASPLLNPSDGPPRLPPVHILPPSSTTTTPTPVPLLIPTLSPTTDSSQPHPALFSPPLAAASPATTSPLGGASSSSNTNVKVMDMSCLLAELSLDSETSLLEYVHDGLKSASEEVKDTLQGRSMEDVQKKLGVMREWWTSGKISTSVKSQMGSMVAALNKQEVETAHELHLALMINHTTEVNQWLVAVKRIIQELRSKGSQVSQGEGQAQPVVVGSPVIAQTDVTSPPVAGDADNKAGCQDISAPSAAVSPHSEGPTEEQS